MEDAATVALVGLAVADAAAYLAWGWGTREDADRRVEVFAAAVTGAGLVVAVVLPLRMGAAAMVGILWGRAVWDALHLGAAPLLGTDVPPRYPWASLVAKAAATALYLILAFPA